MSTKDTSRIGAIGELIICAYLLNKGWHVFRNVSPTGPIDLVAVYNSLIISIDVKTMTPSKDTILRLPKIDRAQCQYLAILHRDTGAIEFDPPLPQIPAEAAARVNFRHQE